MISLNDSEQTIFETVKDIFYSPHFVDEELVFSSGYKTFDHSENNFKQENLVEFWSYSTFFFHQNDVIRPQIEVGREIWLATCGSDAAKRMGFTEIVDINISLIPLRESWGESLSLYNPNGDWQFPIHNHVPLGLDDCPIDMVLDADDRPIMLMSSDVYEPMRTPIYFLTNQETTVQINQEKPHGTRYGQSMLFTFNTSASAIPVVMPQMQMLTTRGNKLDEK